MSPFARVLGSATGTALVLLMITTSVHAQNRCEAAKVKVSGKRAMCILGVEAKAAKKALPPDPLKLQKCKDKFTAGFTKLDAKVGLGDPADDCPAGTGDATAIANRIDLSVDDVVTELGNGDTSPNKCAAGKEKLAGTKVYCKAKVIAAGVRRNVTPDAIKLAGCETKFSTGFGKLDLKNGDGNPADACPNGTGDAATIETKVDGTVGTVAVALAGGTACPFTYEFTANGGDADRDFGWTGNVHDIPFTTNVGLALGIGSCPSGGSPCGACQLFGPITHAGEITFASRRCLGDSSVVCSSDADCGGDVGSCVLFLGPPQPVAAGFISVCNVNYVAAPVSGTIDPDSGSSAFLLDLRTLVYSGGVGATLAHPCPYCAAGTCHGGDRDTRPCTPDGTSALFGLDTSYDCPPTAAAQVANWLRDLPMSTGSQSVTLASDSPACRASGKEALKCFCDTCDNVDATPCFTDGDCIAIGATTCGGTRCLGGLNNGAPCSANSECPSGACNVPGQQTAPNACLDGVCTPNTPPDGDSVNEGVCAAGPVDQYCNLEPFRQCGVDSDCPTAGDTCSISKNRECFTDNGVVGASVSVAGAASPAAPTFGALFCNPPTTAPTVNAQAGVPSLGRWTVPGTATMN